MESTPGYGSGNGGDTADGGDWLAGAVIEFGGDIGPEHVEVRLEGLEFGAEEAVS
jgi:hypothetical protein